MTVAVLILAGLLREKHTGFNVLGWATATMFLSCATGHAIHAEHYFLRADLFAQVPDLWHQTFADGLTLLAALAYLAQRRRYGIVIRGPHALLDYQRRLAVAEALREIGEDVATRTDLDDLLRLLIRHACVLLGADYAAVAVTDESGKSRRHVLGARSSGWESAAWDGSGFIPSPRRDGGAAAPRPLVVADLHTPAASSRPDYVLHRAEGARSLLIAPIARGDEAVGCLVIAYRSARRIGEEDVSSVAALASQAMVAVDNARLIARLRQVDRLKDEFLSAAAHELKTPVTTIKGWMELLLRDGAVAGDARRALEIVLRQTERISCLTEDLVAVVRSRPGPPSLRLESLDLRSLVAERVARLRRSVERELIFSAPGPLAVEADRDLISEVLDRLLENAQRYSRDGAAVEVSVQQVGSEAVVLVRHHGIGIPLERQAHVFEPFYESVPSGKPGYVGLVTLGLYLSRQIVQAHGGRLWLESTPEQQGATFGFGLPLKATEGGSIPRAA